MDNEEYLSTQTQLIVMAQMVKGMDLTGFLDRISHAEAMTPILDPTLWMKGTDKLEKVKRLAQAAREFQKIAEEVAE